LAVQGRLAWPPPEDVVYKALLGQQLDIGEFTDFDDVSVLHCFQLWTKSDNKILAGLCRGLLFRRLYKTFDLTYVQDVKRIPDAVRAAEEAVRAAGGDVRYEMFYDEPADTPYESYEPDQCGGANEILVLERDGKLTPFASLSPLTQSLNRQLMFRRLHVAPQWKDVVGRVVAETLG
jgi:HD superfamily phosphohydrolase